MLTLFVFVSMELHQNYVGFPQKLIFLNNEDL